MSFWNKKCFCLITGASRGIGQELAIQFAVNVGKDSVLCLVARSKEGLEETEKKIQEVAENVTVKLVPMDLSKPNADEFYTMIKEAAGENFEEFEQNLLVHNAASIGNTKKKLIDMEDLEDWQEYFTLNVFSMTLLTSQFFKIFNNIKKERMILQISSLAAMQPFPTWSQYCSAKAARDMIMRVIVAEEPHIKILNYAPGPIDTEMFHTAKDETCNKEFKKDLERMINNKVLLTPTQTVGRLVKIMSKDRFIKADHVDYHDVNEGKM